MEEFKRIFCLYRYNNLFSKIIVNAKDKFNINFQNVFEEIFFQPIKTTLLEIIRQNKYDFIILSPYKKERIFHGYWHPNVLFENVLNEILSELDMSFQIIYTHYISKKSNTVLHIKCDKICEHSKVLLCDDVLTTGSSSRRAHQGLHQHLSNATWDLFTIFRSPQ